MTHSLYSKLILGYLIFGLLEFITTATFSSKMTRDYLVRYQVGAMYNEADVVVSSCNAMYQGRRLDSEEVVSQARALSKYLRVEIWVVNRQETVTTDSQDGPRVQTIITNFDPTAVSNRSYSMDNCYGLFKEDVLSVSVPTTGNYNTYGYALVHLPLSQITQFQDDILNILYIASAIVLALSLIILLASTQTVYLPLCEITYGANEYAVGNLGYRIEVKTHNKIGYLANTLNYMSDEPNKMEEYQKDFVVNVSHDYRSPLTSTKGYLEATLDGTIPSGMYEKYISRVTSGTNHLHKLTESMPTLNSLNAKGYLSCINFDISRVIKDMAASFGSACDAKNISFELTSPDSIQVVLADLGKMQQIPHNLIDNAVKFNHYNSTTYIQTLGRCKKMFVSVKDTGISIPRDSQKKIWERSYKTNLSRGEDKEGTGLEFSAVKKIIQSHGENIDVVSTERVGTEFIFSLPRPIDPQQSVRHFPEQYDMVISRQTL